MSHNIDTMAYVGKVPWHGLGTYVGDSEITGKEMLLRAGLDWTVTKEKLEAVIGDERLSVADRYALVRSDTRTVLGVVGERYTVVNNDAAFGVPDVLVEEGKIGYHTAGSLKGGRIVWSLAKMHGDLGVDLLDGSTDVIERYLLFTNGHDGRHPLVVGVTPIRVVCNNTLNFALGRGLKAETRIRHTAGAEDRIAEAHNLILGVEKAYDGFRETANRLAASRLDKAGFRDFAGEWLDSTKRLVSTSPANDREALVDELLDAPSAETERKRKARRAKVVDELLGYFEKGAGNHGETAWDGYNAVTDWIDHHAERKRRGAASIEKLETAFARNAFAGGTGGKAKAKALSILSKRAS